MTQMTQQEKTWLFVYGIGGGGMMYAWFASVMTMSPSASLIMVGVSVYLMRLLIDRWGVLILPPDQVFTIASLGTGVIYLLMQEAFKIDLKILTVIACISFYLIIAAAFSYAIRITKLELDAEQAKANR